MSAIIVAESAGNPFAIGVNRGGKIQTQPRDRSEAIATARRLLERGANIDLGLGQINSANLSWLGLSVESAFDPCRNIAAAAKILSQNYLQATSRGADAPLAAALSAYNTGSMTNGLANGYVARVYRAARFVVPPLLPDEPTLPPANDIAVDGKADPRPAIWDVFALHQWQERQRQKPANARIPDPDESAVDED